MNKLIEALQEFGLTRQEAGVYLYIYQNADCTGYEIAKCMNISRSNVYNSLGSLVEKGAIYSIEGASTKYVTVPVQEVCDNRILILKNHMKYLLDHMPTTIAREEEGYITIQGHENILNKCRAMLQQVDRRVYFSACSEIIMKFREEIDPIIRSDKKVVLIMNENKEINQYFEKLGCIIYIKKDMIGQFRLVCDSNYVLTAELDEETQDTGLYSKQKNFVQFFKEALSNEISLIEIERNQENE